MHCCIRRDGHRLQAGNFLLLGPQPKHFCPVPMELFYLRAQSGKAIKRESKQFPVQWTKNPLSIRTLSISSKSKPMLEGKDL